MVNLVDGRYKCDWCGADLELTFAARETFEIITQHDDIDIRIIVVNGDEHHRCERPSKRG
jgi:hypothetical protein